MLGSTMMRMEHAKPDCCWYVTSMLDQEGLNVVENVVARDEGTVNVKKGGSRRGSDGASAVR
jgi:hypothetical protein